MKNKIQILLLAGLFSSSVFAQIDEKSEYYFGVGMYQTAFTEHETITDGVTISSDLEYKNLNYSMLVGRRINNNWSVEAQYINLANENIGVIKISGSAESDGDWETEVSGHSIDISGLYYFHTDTDFSPFVKFGIASWRQAVKLTQNDTALEGKDSQTVGIYGVGVDGQINDKMKYRIDFKGIRKNGGNISNLGANLLFDF